MNILAIVLPTKSETLNPPQAGTEGANTRDRFGNLAHQSTLNTGREDRQDRWWRRQRGRLTWYTIES
jgi:hypothetical protein